MLPPRTIRYLLAPTIVPFVLRALLLVTLLTWVTQTEAFDAAIKTPLMRGNAWITHRTLALLGTETRLEGRFVHGDEFSIEIVEGCTGIFVFVLLLSATLAFPSSWRLRGTGLLLGALVVFLLNWLRIVSLFYIGSWRPEWFADAHLYAWQGVTIACVTIYWYAWAVRTAPAPSTAEASAG